MCLNVWLCTEDSGREIEVFAGVRFTAAMSAASKKSSKSSLSSAAAAAEEEESSSAAVSSGLFEMIEDIEQQPIMTPLYAGQFYFIFTLSSYMYSDAIGVLRQ